MRNQLKTRPWLKGITFSIVKDQTWEKLKEILTWFGLRGCVGKSLYYVVVWNGWRASHMGLQKRVFHLVIMENLSKKKNRERREKSGRKKKNKNKAIIKIIGSNCITHARNHENSNPVRGQCQRKHPSPMYVQLGWVQYFFVFLFFFWIERGREAGFVCWISKLYLYSLLEWNTQKEDV